MIPRDDDLLFRAYGLSAWLWGIGCVALMALQNWGAAIGWTVGSAFSLAVVRSLEIVVRRHFVPGNTNARRSFDRAFAVKLPIILLSLIVAVLVGRKCLPFLGAFGVGVVLVQSAIILRTAGLVITEYARDRR